MVLLEAMASGLPVIASDKSGAQDCVAEGRDGFVVATRNVDALAERILWCYERRDETRAMGRAARMKIEQEFTLAHYAERQISLYRQGRKESASGLGGRTLRRNTCRPQCRKPYDTDKSSQPPATFP